MLVAASALLFIQPVFAQADHDSPSEIGSGAWGSTDPVDSDNVPPPSASYAASPHLFDDLSPTYPSAYPSFAQADHDSPSEIGSGAWGSTDPVYSDEPNAPAPYALRSYDDPFTAGPALGPAPEQPAESDPGSMYVPPAPYGLLEVPGHPPISPTSPELIPPDAIARPAGSFGYDGRIH
jgi:hypothetical protein